ncbi:MAG: lipid-A-disaccharide synthase [Proteobacteria bacterium]|nr:lipid-A-disaccharide synthase [Pseudomonadota bacterium]
MLGGRLMAALGDKTGGAARFAGVGGERMISEGLESLFPMGELSVMGYVEVVPRIPRLLARLRQTAAAARALRPDAVVTIDSPEFSFRLARRLAGAGMPLIHYVAPQVWAHRPGRAARLPRLLDHMLALLPFEPPFFETFGLPCSFVGHPVVEEGADRGDGPAFRARHGISPEAKVVCTLAGSRHSEVVRMLPVFGETLGLLAARFPGLRAVAPTVETVAAEVAAAAARWPVDTLVVTGRHEKHDAFAASTVALAASGTVALELAIAGLPAVITYKANPLTVWAARRMMRVPYVSLVNLILDRPVAPELLQERCRPDLLADAVGALLADRRARAEQSAEARRAAELLGMGGTPPSRRAAEVVLDVIAGAARAKPAS